MSGIPLKTVHEWCAVPKERQHKATIRANMKRDEFINFLMQDTIMYSHPCKKYAGKKFILHTWDEIYKRYLTQPEYHKHRIISKTSMHVYKPNYVLLSGKMPLNQCLCDYCENCDLIMKILIAAGVKDLPRNRYECLDESLCSIREGQFGTTYTFAPCKCLR